MLRRRGRSQNCCKQPHGEQVAPLERAGLQRRRKKGPEDLSKHTEALASRWTETDRLTDKKQTEKKEKMFCQSELGLRKVDRPNRSRCLVCDCAENMDSGQGECVILVKG